MKGVIVDAIGGVGGGMFQAYIRPNPLIPTFGIAIMKSGLREVQQFVDRGER